MAASSSVLIPIWSFWLTLTLSRPISASHCWSGLNISRSGQAKAYSRYLRETIRPCLERLERVRDSQVSASFRFMASHDGLEGLLVLPEMNQEQVKRLSTLVAAHMSMCLDAACGDLFVTMTLNQKKSARHGKGWPQRHAP
jgi:predicted ATP-grasp superfamily ATP-dependent carboligase